MKKLKANFSNFLPLGEEITPILIYYKIFMIISTLFTLQFFANFHNFKQDQAHYFLFEQKYIQTEYFAKLLGNGFYFFGFIFIWCFSLCLIYYFLHTNTSKSIYFMKRLRTPFELWKRVLVVPISLSIITIIYVAILLCLYYAFYLHTSVSGTIYDNQMEILIDLWFKGGEKYAKITRYY